MIDQIEYRLEAKILIRLYTNQETLRQHKLGFVLKNVKSSLHEKSWNVFRNPRENCVLNSIWKNRQSLHMKINKSVIGEDWFSRFLRLFVTLSSFSDSINQLEKFFSYFLDYELEINQFNRLLLSDFRYLGLCSFASFRFEI